MKRIVLIVLVFVVSLALASTVFALDESAPGGTLTAGSSKSPLALEALAIVEKDYAGHIVKCNGKWYRKSIDFGLTYHELSVPYHIQIIEQKLSEIDKMNGIEFLGGIDWVAKGKVIWRDRKYNSYDKVFLPWGDYSATDYMRLNGGRIMKKKGKWDFRQSDRNTHLTCAEVPMD